MKPMKKLALTFMTVLLSTQVMAVDTKAKMYDEIPHNQ